MKIDVAALGGCAGNEPTVCKICSGEAELFDVVDFQKFCSTLDPYGFGVSGVPVYYHRCKSCGFTFTRFMDDWTGEQFARHVYNDEYALVDPEYAGSRPSRISETFAALLGENTNVSILDYGAGGGAFKECLKQFGFRSVQEYDPFSHPKRPTGPYHLVFASEVVEHSPDPVATFRDMAAFLREGGAIIFSTALQPADFLKTRAAWWYVAPRNGHISIFSHEALDALAKVVGMQFFFARDWLVFARSAEHLDRLGLDYRQERRHVLLAPADLQPGWHGVEELGGTRYRWTAEERVTWSLPVVNVSTTFLLSLPCRIEALAGLAKQHSLRVNGQELPVQVTRGSGGLELSTSVRVKPWEKTSVDLTVPKLTGPDDRGNSDPRKLGLLIPVG